MKPRREVERMFNQLPEGSHSEEQSKTLCLSVCPAVTATEADFNLAFSLNLSWLKDVSSLRAAESKKNGKL